MPSPQPFPSSFLSSHHGPAPTESEFNLGLPTVAVLAQNCSFSSLGGFLWKLSITCLRAPHGSPRPVLPPGNWMYPLTPWGPSAKLTTFQRQGTCLQVCWFPAFWTKIHFAEWGHLWWQDIGGSHHLLMTLSRQRVTLTHKALLAHCFTWFSKLFWNRDYWASEVSDDFPIITWKVGLVWNLCYHFWPELYLLASLLYKIMSIGFPP